MSQKKPFIPKGSGVALGLVLGVAFGAALDNIGIGIALGLILGAAYDAARSGGQDDGSKGK